MGKIKKKKSKRKNKIKVIKSISKMTKYAKRLRRQGKKIGFVPTMGYLHDGHLSLMRKARKENDVVAISIFVNPTQFRPKEDFKKYPRDFKRDKRLAQSCDVDIIFYPNAKNIYPPNYRTYVNVEGLTEVLCGASRPEHFRGVTTIVMKLFNIVKPHIAYFGQKDAQQATVIRQMVKDLNMPLKIKILPIVREKDGLAMSSRNVYLNEKERKDALILYRSLLKARGLIKKGERNADRIKTVMKNMIRKKKTAKIDYVSIVDTKKLEDMKLIKSKVLIALAVKIGATRLIDNIVISGQGSK